MDSVRFPSRLQKFVRVPPGWLYEMLSQFLGEAKEGAFRVNVGGRTGVTLRVRLVPEGDSSSLDLDFSYRGLMIMVLLALIVVVGLCLLFSSAIPLAGLIIILLVAYRAGLETNEFIREFNNVLIGLEAEYARKSLMEDRIRWQMNPKDINDLYRRLREKHIKVWGNTFILEYKIGEYQRHGLTRDEAIRKIAEEEGIF